MITHEVSAIVPTESSDQYESCLIEMKTWSVQEADTHSWVTIEWDSQVKARSQLLI